jgi:tetratricopeptide (TPR) repeat protein
LGLIYAEKNNYEVAKENFLMAATAQEYRTPENAYANLAQLEIKFGHDEAALRHIEKGLTFNANFATLHALKANLLEKAGQTETAIATYERAINLMKEPEVGVVFRLAQLYLDTDKRNKAIVLLEDTLSKLTHSELKKEVVRRLAEIEKSK